MSEEFTQAVTLLFILLNPFLMSVYLLDLIEDLTLLRFAQVIFRAATISFVVFTLFAYSGEKVFTEIFHVRFESFLLFGGCIFLLTGLRFLFQGPAAIRDMRGGDAEHVAGSVAMPFMIGPGTVSASVVSGSQLSIFAAAGAIALALVLVVIALVIFKWIHDYIKERNEELLARYVDMFGRASALLIGTYAVEMILQGIRFFVRDLQAA